MPIWINQTQIDAFQFSGGEWQVKITADLTDEPVAVCALLWSADDIMQLLLTVDAMRRVKPSVQIELSIPYLPYARQDRVCQTGEALSLKVMAQLINGLNCQTVTLFDPHSDVAADLIENCRIVSLADRVTTGAVGRFIRQHNFCLIAPDAGAEKKVHQTALSFAQAGVQLDLITASKHRDVTTGHITETKLHGDVAGKNVIILDDICDGGRTFIELSKQLKQQGAGKIYLFVTHGIFSKGLDVLKPHFDHVFCLHAQQEYPFDETKFLTVENALTHPLYA